MSIGEKLRMARKTMGVSQESLAEKLGVTTQAVSTWERDENLPETKKLLAVANVLHLSLDYLMTEENDNWTIQLLHPNRMLDKAISYATVKHSGMFRKGTNTPYIVHPLEVAAIVSGLTDDEEVISAAVLHDVLEDTNTTRDELEQAFNKRIADLVANESENKRDDQPAHATWQVRKSETILHLTKASHEAKLIVLGDKLANMRAIHRDYEALGEDIWERFNEKNKASHAWYYDSILQILASDPELADTPCLHELAYHIYDVFNDVLEDDSEQDENEGLRICCFYPDAMPGLKEKLPNGCKAWALILDRTKDDDLKQLQIMAMIYDYFLRSDDVGFSDTHLVLTNDPDREDISWEKLPDGYAIHLCAISTKNWCQVGYQLGYAMIHCLIDHLHPDDPSITWVEELICETGTLYLLKLLAKHWSETPFGKEDPDYVQAIDTYINDNLSDKGTGALTRCADRLSLQKLNNTNLFDDRINESHVLYSIMEDEDLLRLAEVRNYAADHLLLHTHFWRSRANQSQAIEYICCLQEQISGCEIPAGVPIVIDLENSHPTIKQCTMYDGLIRTMRILPGEYIIFDFMNANKEDCEQIGLVFYQVTRDKDGSIVAEIRLDTKTGRKMYRLFCDDDCAVNILNEILMNNQVPDLNDWQDVTDLVFHSHQITQKIENAIASQEYASGSDGQTTTGEE